MGLFNLSWIWSFFLSIFSSFTQDSCSHSSSSGSTSDLALSSIKSSALRDSDSVWQTIPRALGFQFHKKKLVLDLDETLISSSQKHCFRHDISVLVNLSGNHSMFYVRKRPHVDLFLEKVSEWFELVIFTASLSPYANAVIDQLDPKRRINRRYYRQSCTNRDGSYLKNLHTVCRDLSRVVIVDNSPVAFSLNKENGIAIPDYFGTNPDDESLLDLLPILEKVRDAEDVRTALVDHPNGVCGLKSPTPGIARRSNRS